eukprot:1073499-Pelagomonas_calceolata.AAC.7
MHEQFESVPEDLSAHLGCTPASSIASVFSQIHLDASKKTRIHQEHKTFTGWGLIAAFLSAGAKHL